MDSKTINGGWYAAALPTGEWVAVRHDGPDLESHLGHLSPGERILFPDITTVGGFKIAGQAHPDPPRVLEYQAGAWQVRPELPSGTSPVIYRPDGTLRVNEPGSSVGSQGFRYIDANGEVFTGDATYGQMDGVLLHEWTDFPGVGRFGQGPDDNGFWFYDYATGLYHELITGKARFGRVKSDGQVYAIACWVEPHRSELRWLTVAEIRATIPGQVTSRLPVTPPPPPVPPPPDPEPEPMPTVDTSRLHAALVAERAKYPATLQAEAFAASILNAACWAVRDEGWGLSAKPTGNQIWSVEHQRHVSYDALHHQPTDTIWDCATDEWPTMRITTPHNVEHHGRADRPWLAPVRPTTDDEPVPPTPDPPTPDPPQTPPGCQCAGVLEAIAAVLAELHAHREDFDMHRQYMADMEITIRNEIRSRMAPTYRAELDLGWLGGKRTLVLVPDPEPEQ